MMPIRPGRASWNALSRTDRELLARQIWSSLEIPKLEASKEWDDLLPSTQEALLRRNWDKILEGEPHTKRSSLLEPLKELAREMHEHSAKRMEEGVRERNATIKTAAAVEGVCADRVESLIPAIEKAFADRSAIDAHDAEVRDRALEEAASLFYNPIICDAIRAKMRGSK